MEKLVIILVVFCFVIIVYFVLKIKLKKFFEEQKKKNEEESKKLLNLLINELNKLQDKNKEDIKEAISSIAKFYSRILIDCDEEILHLLEKQGSFCDMFSKIKEIIIAKNKFENIPTFFPHGGWDIFFQVAIVDIEEIKKEREKTKNQISFFITEKLKSEFNCCN